MGALSSLASLMMVIAPFLGGPLLAIVSHAPPGDWRLGAPYFLSSALMVAALAMTAWYFARHHVAAPKAIAVPQREA
jgi:DHA1 family tetracycline resistance protein-like MFS transporter